MKVKGKDLKAYLKSLSQIDREHLGHMAGCTGAYVTSLIYKKNNTCSLALAVAIDKISGGNVDFRGLVLKSGDVDWEYVQKALTKRPPIFS